MLVMKEKRTQWVLCQSKLGNAHGPYEIVHTLSGRSVAHVDDLSEAALLLYAPEMREALEIARKNITEHLQHPKTKEQFLELALCFESLTMVIEQASKKAKG